MGKMTLVDKNVVIFLPNQKGGKFWTSRVVEQVKLYQTEFASFIESPCGVNLGTIEPLDYPANYMIDERSPIIDLETNTSRSE